MGNSQSKPAGPGERSSLPAESPHHRRTASQRRRIEQLKAAEPGSSSHQYSSNSAQPIPLSRTSNKQSAVSANSSPSQQARDAEMGSVQSREKRRDAGLQQAAPVQVPSNHSEKRQKGAGRDFESSGPPRESYVNYSALIAPPRLPLPIQEEVHVPGSPIIAPDDLVSPIVEDDIGGPLIHQASLLSHTTADDDEEYDPGFGLEGIKGRTVPTVVTWKAPADRVYITGTFVSWSKKYRMQKDPTTKIFKTTLDLPPGTHHIRFIVDGDMQLSNELPTAVDYTNVLVNYIEVSADDLPPEVDENAAKTDAVAPGIDAKDHEPSPEQPEGQTEQTTSPRFFGPGVPKYLLDFDKEDNGHRAQRAESRMQDMPQPPSLPLFLGKSILNGTTPMKDDNSVLTMPNHTVLNHLTTSSIKNETLATSLTTRYKRKYVTTITYRPTTVAE